jgi:hypothetical protein
MEYWMKKHHHAYSDYKLDYSAYERGLYVYRRGFYAYGDSCA